MSEKTPYSHDYYAKEFADKLFATESRGIPERKVVSSLSHSTRIVGKQYLSQSTLIKEKPVRTNSRHY